MGLSRAVGCYGQLLAQARGGRGLRQGAVRADVYLGKRSRGTGAVRCPACAKENRNPELLASPPRSRPTKGNRGAFIGLLRGAVTVFQEWSTSPFIGMPAAWGRTAIEICEQASTYPQDQRRFALTKILTTPVRPLSG